MAESDSPAEPGRTPPIAVRRQLRQEVGYHCPVDGCNSPYLTWHHFDPPWRAEHHHRPEGLIALCLGHAAKADGGAYTNDQLTELKRLGRGRSEAVRGKFDWMRRNLLIVAGGNFYYDVPVILMLGDRPSIWTSRNEQGELQLGFWMPTLLTEPRAYMVNNSWVIPPGVADVDCPPQGRKLLVKYANGDQFAVEFLDVESLDDLDQRYADAHVEDWHEDLPFPLTAVEVWQTAAGLPLEFGPRSSRIGTNLVRNCFMRGGQIAMQVGPSLLVKSPISDQDEPSG